MNCALAFRTLHQAWIVIGDVNKRNILVSSNATVVLIDCDSFQVRAHDRVLTCNVGVSDFTPPELQGHSFRGLQRCEDHDCFGLATLIFHLLVLGRHPFEGCFTGQGEMPTEKAIAQSRFAYGRSAESYEMQPPPGALTLGSVPPQIADLFERAFAQRSPHTCRRPPASEWEAALNTFRRQLKVCAFDSGHTFSAHLSDCPWCEFMRKGLPNFFISVSLYSDGRDSSTPSFDIIWAQIEQIGPPPTAYAPFVTPFKVVTRPLPPWLPESIPPAAPIPRDDNQLILGIATLASLLVLMPFVLFLPVLGMVGFVFSLIFGTWWIILERKRVHDEETANLEHQQARAAYQAEYCFRCNARDQAASSVEQTEKAWTDAAKGYAKAYNERMFALRDLKSRYQSLQSSYNTERQQLLRDARFAQLSLYLQGHLINNYDIPDVGAARKATLASYGIETAEDITEQAIVRVPGFGRALLSRLLRWRQEVEARFVYDATAGMSAMQTRAADLKHRQARQSVELQLQREAPALSSISQQAAIELNRLRERIRESKQQLVQAEADLQVLSKQLQSATPPPPPPSSQDWYNETKRAAVFVAAIILFVYYAWFLSKAASAFLGYRAESQTAQSSPSRTPQQ
jgi:DNA-binding helix-hairpin-helix protein with protein kinase domain